jgi:hypothetical protein
MKIVLTEIGKCKKKIMSNYQINYFGIHAVVVGGSLGGFSSALAMRCVNCYVVLLQRVLVNDFVFLALVRVSRLCTSNVPLTPRNRSGRI